jgi:hypothetical protein
MHVSRSVVAVVNTTDDEQVNLRLCSAASRKRDRQGMELIMPVHVVARVHCQNDVAGLTDDDVDDEAAHEEAGDGGGNDQFLSSSHPMQLELSAEKDDKEIEESDKDEDEDDSGRSSSSCSESDGCLPEEEDEEADEVVVTTSTNHFSLVLSGSQLCRRTGIIPTVPNGINAIRSSRAGFVGIAGRRKRNGSGSSRCGGKACCSVGGAALSREILLSRLAVPQYRVKRKGMSRLAVPQYRVKRKGMSRLAVPQYRVKRKVVPSTYIYLGAELFVFFRVQSSRKRSIQRDDRK